MTCLFGGLFMLFCMRWACKCTLPVSRDPYAGRFRDSERNGTSSSTFFTYYHLFSCVPFTSETKVQSSEVDEVFFRRCTSGFAWSSDDLPHFFGYPYSLGAALRNQGVLSVPGFLSPLVDVQLSENAKTAWCVRGRRAQGLVPDLFLSHGRQAWRPTFLNAWVS